MNIAIIGYGGVGKALIKLLGERAEWLTEKGLNIKVTYIVNSKGGIKTSEGIALTKLTQHALSGIELKDFVQQQEGCQWIERAYDAIESITADETVDMVILLTPTNKETGQPGLDYAKKFLYSGKHVVMADKGPVIHGYKELKKLAENKGKKIGLGCTAGGALPSINGGLIDMAGSDIFEIEGILNGTTNYILERMEEGLDYNDALTKAQMMGIAEANPYLDVEGWDTAGKMLILANVLMDADLQMGDVYVEGITSLAADDILKAAKQDCRIKLIGKVKRNPDGSIKAEVKPVYINKHDLMYGVCGRNKAVKYVSDTLGELVIMGGASGTTPAAASVLRDVVNIYKNL